MLACLGSQYAGWSLAATKEQTGGKKFFSLGSGPARALAVKEPLFAELGYRDHHDRGALVLEVDRLPPQVIIDKVLADCGLAPERLTLVTTPTHSVAGTVQVVARVVEVALHKTHVLGVRAAMKWSKPAGSAPLPPPAPDGVQAMGRTNDAILYGGRVHLTVRHDAVANGSPPSCPRRTRAITAARSRTSSRRSTTTSIRSIPRCSLLPKCGSAASKAARRITAAASHADLLHAQWSGKP